MKNHRNSMLGVTLLEIMLVLAIAAIIVLMSIRFYRGANSAQQANAMFSTMQALVAAYEHLSTNTGGSFTGISSASAVAYLGMPSLNSPWGKPITVMGDQNKLSFTASGVPDTVCTLMLGKLKAIANYDTPPPSCAGGELAATFTR